MVGVDDQDDDNVGIPRDFGAIDGDRRHKMPVFPFQCSLRVNIVNGEWPARSCQAYCRAATHLTQTHYSSPQHFHLSFDIAFRSTSTAPSTRFPSVGPVRSQEHT